jgi:hypothetical protein
MHMRRSNGRTLLRLWLTGDSVQSQRVVSLFIQKIGGLRKVNKPAPVAIANNSSDTPTYRSASVEDEESQ